MTTKKGAGRNGFRLREAKAVAYTEIESQDDVRISSGVTEFDRVLGGGIVPGTLVLLGGDPGIGKSTLLLQVADKLSASGTLVLYVSGEESERQIKLRGERLGVQAPNLLLLPEAAGRGKVVPSGKIFEYLAAERPILAAVPTDGAAAQLVRETGAGVVVAPDDEDGLRAALVGLHARWRAGQLANGYLSEDQRHKLSRTTRVEELAELLWSLE